MKLVLLAAFSVACVTARPQPEGPAQTSPYATPVPILLDERIPIDSYGGYGFKFQTGDGLSWAETASPQGPDNQIGRIGQYRFTHPDGTPHLLTYTAGVGGFLPISDLIPTPHPLEPWHIEQIEFAEREKAAAAGPTKYE
ncbi:cuticle protein AM1199-like [Homarus americanus]|uniref:Cuticle protein n=1 Tax=Homarus americanus TaxID=6706 RepID=A0A8J5N329_HOMAM|nr:cuticle protein AM1199-like [Homarus americanus]KAG7172453.1 Cuticle protein [Homarus americanus]